MDPPFFQKESDSSNEDKPVAYSNLNLPPRLTTVQSSSADDYRSVIDDLTIEIQKLKEQLKKYKQRGPEMLRKDKLFEIKFHSLPKRKRLELETTLRDFTASMADSPDASMSQRKKASRHANRDHMYSGSGSASKHASSSSGSNARPVDSAYASMSSGANSSGASLNRPAMSARARSNDQKVENYLRDIPEGLYPRHMVLTDRERKKLVVRRLEQLFTGKIAGRHARRAKQRLLPFETLIPDSDASRNQKDQSIPAVNTVLHAGPELSREAKILPREHFEVPKNSRSRDNGSASNSNGDQTESGGHGNSSRSGTNVSPSQPPAPDQRPTRLKDLDPDRVQNPSENMDYIRHLGLVPPELLADTHKEVQPDAEGWVYLNLLCSLAQLHIVNVTPSFVRSAVTEISTKFQLSADGRKIRWSGGCEGTRFSSDSSNGSSQSTPILTDPVGADKEGPRKRQKTGNSTGDEIQSGGSSKSRSKSGPQISSSSESFHYKPLFAHNSSPNEQTSMDDTLSSFGPIEDSNVDESRWGFSGSGTSNRRKRRHDGAIIYYSGAPFCTDLSGDAGDQSPATYMLTSGQNGQEPLEHPARPSLYRSASGSSLSYRPLSDLNHGPRGYNVKDLDIDNLPELAIDSTDSEDELPEAEFPWSDSQQFIDMHPLEPCGLGGVMPDDHFMVVVTTKRPRNDRVAVPADVSPERSEEATEFIIGRLASMSASSPAPLTVPRSSAVEIEYVSGRIKRLAPVALPPPVIFMPPFSSDSSSEGDDEYDSEAGGDDSPMSEELMSRQANPHLSDGYPDGADLSSGDEDGEEPDEDSEGLKMYDRMDTASTNISRTNGDGKSPLIGSAEAAPGSTRRRSKSASADPGRTGASSAATAGGIRSGCSSEDGT